MFKSEIAVHHHGSAIFLCKDDIDEASSLNTMQALGLISLLIAIGIGVMFMTSDTKINNDGDTVGSTHESAIDAAKEAVGAIEVSTGGGGRSISIYDGVSVPSGSTKVDLSGRGLSAICRRRTQREDHRRHRQEVPESLGSRRRTLCEIPSLLRSQSGR